MTDTVTTLATGNISEEVIAQYLEGLGMDAMEPMWYELEHTIRPLIPQFLAGGGNYRRRDESDRPNLNVGYQLRDLAMVASYGSKSVELRRYEYNGYTSIHLIHPYDTNYFHDSEWWCGVEVHPRYLDIVLCSMMGVPETKPLPINSSTATRTVEYQSVDELTRRPSDLPEG